MELKFILKCTIFLSVLAAATVNVSAARRVILRPLSAKEVVRILKVAGREDAIPEGRVVSQGIAAMTGFALGLTKGIGGSLLFDLATSNETAQYLNNFNVTGMMGDYQGVDMSALTQMFSWGTPTNSNGIKYKTTEICFDTRIEEPVVEEMARQATATSPAATTGTADEEGTNTTDAIDTGTGAEDGTVDSTDTDAGFDTVIDTGDETNTKTDTLTEADTDKRQTCIVLQKPIITRKRRSTHRKRRR